MRHPGHFGTLQFFPQDRKKSMAKIPEQSTMTQGTRHILRRLHSQQVPRRYCSFPPLRRSSGKPPHRQNSCKLHFSLAGNHSNRGPTAQHATGQDMLPRPRIHGYVPRESNIRSKNLRQRHYWHSHTLQDDSVDIDWCKARIRLPRISQGN